MSVYLRQCRCACAMGKYKQISSTSSDIMFGRAHSKNSQKHSSVTFCFVLVSVFYWVPLLVSVEDRQETKEVALATPIGWASTAQTKNFLLRLQKLTKKQRRSFFFCFSNLNQKRFGYSWRVRMFQEQSWKCSEWRRSINYPSSFRTLSAEEN